MSIDIKELKRLARKVAECEDQPEIADEHAEAADALWLHMHCHTILGLIEEIERRDENPNFRAVQSARQEAERLTAENEALRQDAERYRWLRDPDNQCAVEDASDYYMPPMICGYAEHEDILTHDSLDKAIDAALVKERGL